MTRRLLALAALVLTPAVWAAPLQDTIRRSVWDDGLTVVTSTDDSSPITVLELVIRGGRRSEPPGREGLSYFTTRLSLEIPDESKVQELMEKSSRYQMTSRGDESVIHVECLTEFLDDTLRVLLKILDDPLFSGLRVQRIRDFMDNQRQIEADDNLSLGHITLLGALLGPLGYGGSVYGTKESLSALRARDLEAYYKDRFRPANMILVSISDLPPGDLDAALRKHFGAFKAGAPGRPAEPTRAEAARAAEPLTRETVIEKDTKQVFISVGFPLPPVEPKTYVFRLLLECLLGKGPGSRLWPLRTERKLAYNVSARAESLAAGGLFEAYLETDAAKREEARQALVEALNTVAESGVTDEELAAAKAFARTDFLRANETKGRRASTLGALESLGLGAGRFDRLPDDLASVSLEDMNSFIRRTLDPGRSWLVLVGPKR